MIDRLGGFGGIVIVVTNPVDLLARLVHTEAGISEERVLGLGTVVETARLRWALANYLVPVRLPSEVRAYAIGTHDEHFVPVIPPRLAPGEADLGAGERDILAAARGEVARGAGRVKSIEGRPKSGGEAPSRGTMHPVVEGVVSILDAVALDRGTTHTVSVLDPEDRDALFYSMPCVIDRSGVRTRRTGDLLDDAPVAEALEQCKVGLRECLRSAGEQAGV